MTEVFLKKEFENVFWLQIRNENGSSVGIYLDLEGLKRLEKRVAQVVEVYDE